MKMSKRKGSGGKKRTSVSNYKGDDRPYDRELELQAQLAKKLKKSKGEENDGLDELLNGFEGSEEDDEEELSYDEPSTSGKSKKPTAIAELSKDKKQKARKSSTQRDESRQTKYVPPNLRAKNDNEDGLSRKIRGLLNRVTEENVTQIVYEICNIVNSFEVARNTTFQLICDGLIRAAAEGPRASDQFAAVTSVCAFGMAAQLESVELLAKFTALVAEKISQAQACENSRALHNLVLILVHLYSVSAIDNSIVYSFLFHLKAGFSEADIECIYTVLRYVGSSLRTSDPGMMKNFVIAVHERAGEIRSSTNEGLSKKQEILLNSVVDIKNNKQRGTFGRSYHSISPSVSTWLKKMHASELCLLNLSWDNLIASDKRGLWWLSGSDVRNRNVALEMKAVSHGVNDGHDYLKLASEQRMNTDIRRSIFVVIMSSADYMDAYERLLRLGLKGSQEREISRVLLHCCLQEKAYNPYYFHIAKSIIKQSKQHQLSFIFAISDNIKELQKMETRSIANIAKLTSSLIIAKCLPFTIIKVIGADGKLSKRETLFLQVFLEQYLSSNDDELIHNQFITFYMKTEYANVRNSLAMFFMKSFKRYLSHSKMQEDKFKELESKGAVALHALTGNAL